MTATAPTPTEPGTRPGLRRHEVLVAGGGSAGIAVAARLRRAAKDLDIAIVEPSSQHAYQPLWTLVGGGAVDARSTVRRESPLIPRGVSWIKSAVAEFLPDENALVTTAGERIDYGTLIVAVGLQIDWHAIPGLEQAIAEGHASSIWSFDGAQRTWQAIQGFKGGTALFTFPTTPIKCPGAAQKIMYLADDHFRRAGVRDGSRIVFGSAGPRIFGVDKYAATLDRVIARKGIETHFRHNLVEVRPAAREAVFQHLDSDEQLTITYDLLHVAPPQSAPDVVKRSPLAGPNGWVEVDRETLQHTRYANVFALGDASSCPTSKTGAAIRAQAPIVAANLVAARAGRELPRRYDGYTACPLVTGYGKLVLAEFDYDCQPQETFPFDQSKERLSMYLLKKHGLPRFYWHAMLRGQG
jgi:sulfide:quinone oxidoreductase